MIKLKQFVFGVYYVFKSMGPMLVRWYEEGTALLAVIQAELEGMNGDITFSKVNKSQRSRAKKAVAVRVIKSAVISPLKKETDEIINKVIESAWSRLLKK